jgi:formylglycine-generating enzyme required for sulfatase activity
MGEDDDAHEVTLTEPFLLGTYEVTQGQYEKIVGEFGVSAGLEFDFNKPAHPLTWNQAALFCNKLSELQSEKTAGRVYELPTEAQWEYACRAGTITRYSFGNDVAKLSRYARVFTSPPYIPSAQRMQKVGQRLPNAWRLFDMHGNAYEWCRDTFASYPTQSALNPVNLSSSGIGIIRGGSAWFRSSNATSAYRKRWNREGARLTGNGFRVACRAKQVGEDSNPSATQMNTARPDSTDRMKSPPAATTNKPPPANAPFDAATAKEHQWAWAKDLGVEVETENSIGMKLRVIPPGTFMMGEYGGAHEVTLTKPFMLGTYEVTQAQYQKAMGTNPSTFKGANNPVEMVSWNDAVEFCRRLSELPAEKAAGRVYRLPTEAEWECACRAGTTTEYSFGNDDGRLNVYGWFNGNSGNTTHSVGGKRPNAWELYDMHGNVYEWCQDSYGPYPNRAVTDPTGAGTGLYRVYRGGRGNGPAWACRSWDRNRCPPADLSDYYGFRVCLSLSGS